ncbi:polyketide synthase [Nostoc punctiforme]|uniref:Enoyl-CoA hydratase/isomerase n=1 Tax=Nostoc punctiforme (strain ATCC 29133 / PCC 73102) TaxID=63737 RepID=B2IYP2_NOSP7|nr:polyketide synthase [Nostoc punctiforme]ACC81625.1 Enoyl-CoA hydratase/isomerase [Nostoc punctiforme PCC 73102]
MSEIVTLSCLEDGIYQINLNDLQNDNQLTDELVDIFLKKIAECAKNPHLKVLLITGLPKIFCGGASLDVLQKLLRGDTEVKDLLLPTELLRFPVPVIAAMEGHAVGGGLLIALCCDVIIAAQESRYGVNFAGLGFTPGMGTTSLLPSLVGPLFAHEMILTAKLYKGRELQGRGLFNDVVPKQQVIEVAMDIARNIAEKPKHVLEMVKDTLALPRQRALQEAMSREHLMHTVCFNHPDTQSIVKDMYIS